MNNRLFPSPLSSTFKRTTRELAREVNSKTDGYKNNPNKLKIISAWIRRCYKENI